MLRQQLEQVESVEPRTPEPVPKKVPRRKLSDFQMQERVKELEVMVLKLQKEQREDREMLRMACAQRDRLRQQLRQPRTQLSRSTQSSSKDWLEGESDVKRWNMHEKI